MREMDRIRIELLKLPDPTITQRELAYRVLLITALQFRIYKPPDDPSLINGWIVGQLEYIFNKALGSGAFDNAGVLATSLDDLCGDLGLFGVKPYAKKVINET